MSYDYIPDHIELALDTWLSQDRIKPRLRALMGAAMEQVQYLEDMMWDAYVSTPLTAASGAGLDLWGQILGEPREGAEDADYRRFLEARVLALICEGSQPEIERIWVLITQPIAYAYQDLYPAAYRLLTLRDAPMGDDLIARVKRLMEQVRPAGIGQALTEGAPDPLTLQDDAQTFDGPLFTRRL
jgi:hypothetical protein